MYEIASIVGDEFTWVMTVSLSSFDSFIHFLLFYFILCIKWMDIKT